MKSLSFRIYMAPPSAERPLLRVNIGDRDTRSLRMDVVPMSLLLALNRYLRTGSNTSSASPRVTVASNCSHNCIVWRLSIQVKNENNKASSIPGAAISGLLMKRAIR